MATDREEEIRKRAYEIWEREGSPDGREMEHWTDAERELSANRSEAPAVSGTAARSATSPETKAADKPKG